ncbi:MAG: hypothetical protein A2X46_06610 [Lentisphaerae bacterium GWF2_57_35]|nr:MAG: hypothetical protein A2X46_06610 [Lentisphaerae bacterium GWF2_57_35]
MKQLLIQLIKNTPLYQPLIKWIIRRQQKRDLVEWEKKGRPVPPPHIVKQRTLRAFAKKFGLKILVETGTYYGDMVEAMKGDFNRIYSIELGKELYEKAKKRFEGEGKVELIHGDSGFVLKNLIERIDEPALFWLDGHYSAGVTAKGGKVTPIYEELTHIFKGADRGHVIIIDDARCFGKSPDYPSLKDLSDFIRSNKPDAHIAIEDDSIRITPSLVSN